VWSSLSYGRTHGCAIGAESDLYCWGDNSRGQLGIGSAGDFVPYPVWVD
jgi:alpha-tubulin suppressor-like RCC1 family protein